MWRSTMRFFTGPMHWTGQRFFPMNDKQKYPECYYQNLSGVAPYFITSEREGLIEDENYLCTMLLNENRSSGKPGISNPLKSEVLFLIQKTFRMHAELVGFLRFCYGDISEGNVQRVTDVKIGLAKQLRVLAGELEKEAGLMTSG